MLASSTEPLLRVQELSTGYGRKPVLNGVSLSIEAGEIVAVIGHNGSGKSTLLKAIVGLIPTWNGQIVLDGSNLEGSSPAARLRAGMSYAPQGGNVFDRLSVRDNLEAAALVLSGRAARERAMQRALEFFPTLSERLHQVAGTLSGGEQQIVSLAMSLALSPRLLLMDEPSLGLAPRLVTETMDRLRDLNAETGVTIVIVEQKVREVLRVASRVYVLRTGLVSFEGSSAELAEPERLREAYL